MSLQIFLSRYFFKVPKRGFFLNYEELFNSLKNQDFADNPSLRNCKNCDEKFIPDIVFHFFTIIILCIIFWLHPQLCGLISFNLSESKFKCERLS
jgi:hypothetical protein